MESFLILRLHSRRTGANHQRAAILYVHSQMSIRGVQHSQLPNSPSLATEIHAHPYGVDHVGTLSESKFEPAQVNDERARCA